MRLKVIRDKQGSERERTALARSVPYASGRLGVTGVEEERLHLCHEHISVSEKSCTFVNSEAVSVPGVELQR